jgi:predicted nucleic acid-binding protein
LNLLLDTSVISELRKVRSGRAHREIVEWEHRVSATDLYLSVASIHEIEFGILQLEKTDPMQSAVLRGWLTHSVLTAFGDRLLVVDAAIAQRAAYLHTLKTRSYCDALIAATAYVHRMPVVTRNVSHFHDTGVQLINPWLP